MISILLPTYNQARFLPDALAGLKAQTYQDFELIACDDGSTDETAQTLEAAGVRTVTHPENRGTAAAINSAAALARDAEFMTWVSSDNVMYPEWLETLKEYLENGFQAAYSAYHRLDMFPDAFKKPRQRLILPGPYEPDRLISSLNCYGGPSFLIRRGAWLEHREGLAHDYDWWLRLEERNGWSVGYCPTPLCEYRMGPWQTGRNRPGLLENAQRRQTEAVKRRGDKTAIKNPARKCRELNRCIKLATAGCIDVLELGCGFGDRLQEVDAVVRTGIDAHEPYIAEARRRYPDSSFVIADAREYVRGLNGAPFGAILMVDFLEHLSRAEAIDLLDECKRISRRIVLYVPLGNHPQTGDPYNMGGERWQAHRSTWEPADLEAMGFDIEVWRTHPNKPVDPRAAFCIWNEQVSHEPSEP